LFAWNGYSTDGADKGNGPIAGCDVLIALKAAEEASQFDFQPSTFTACA
jgi:hypothetical protein